MKNKVLIFSYDFPPSDGGIARLCSEIASNLNTREYDLMVLTTDHQGANNATYNLNGIQIVRKASKRIQCEWEMFGYLRSIRNKADYTILCGLWYPEGLLALLAGFKNVYLLTHGAELRPGKSLFRKHVWQPIVAGWVLKRAKRVVANSEYTAGLSRFVSPHAHVVALPLAVNSHYFTPDHSLRKEDGNLTLCTVSRICKFKGHDTIAGAINLLPAALKEKIRWKIAGNGPYKQTLMQLVDKLGLSSQTEFLGFVSDADLPKVYQSSDVFVLCTREEKDSEDVEGFGLVFLEAQSCGIPAIGKNAGGIPSAVKEGDGGWLIQDKDDLSKLLSLLIEDKEICRIMGSKARQRVEKEATWTIYTDKLIQYLGL